VAVAELGSFGGSATFMNRTLRYAGFVLGILTAGVAAQDQGKPATPAEQHQALLKELQGNV
jgi:arylamine N-acetyltransferase